MCAWAKSIRLRRKTEAFVLFGSEKIFCPTAQSVGAITPCQKHCVVGPQGGSYCTVESGHVTLPRHVFHNECTRKVSVCVLTTIPVKEVDECSLNFYQSKGDCEGNHRGKMREKKPL